MNSIEILKSAGVIPVVVLENADDAAAAANAMLAGGINVMEITFRTAAAKDSIAQVAAKCPDMLVGAGTVLNVEQAKEAVNAGAKFIVCPGLSIDVVKWCKENNVTVVPGCVTPSEIMTAISFGIDVVKFFPAGAFGGINTIKALHGPFGNISFIPTGGVSAKNLEEYLKIPYICAVGGSWVCDKQAIADGDFEKITQLCKEAMEIKNRIR